MSLIRTISVIRIRAQLATVNVVKRRLIGAGTPVCDASWPPKRWRTTKPWQRLTPLLAPFISTLLYRYHVTVNMTTVIISPTFVAAGIAVISPIFTAARPIGA
jgi:hypothetical protein